MTKERLEVKFKQMIGDIDTSDHDSSGWYAKVIWDGIEKSDVPRDSCETVETSLARQGIEYAELYDLMREIVKKITHINNNHYKGAVSVDGEWAAACFFATELAKENEEDIELFVDHLSSRDPDHEADPYNFYGVHEVLGKHGYTMKTLPIVLAVYCLNSQHRSGLFSELSGERIIKYLKQDRNMEEFLPLLARWVRDHGDDDTAEELFNLFLSAYIGVEDEDEEQFYEISEKLAEQYMNSINEGKIPAEQDIRGFLDNIS